MRHLISTTINTKISWNCCEEGHDSHLPAAYASIDLKLISLEHLLTVQTDVYSSIHIDVKWKDGFRITKTIQRTSCRSTGAGGEVFQTDLDVHTILTISNHRTLTSRSSWDYLELTKTLPNVLRTLPSTEKQLSLLDSTTVQTVPRHRLMYTRTNQPCD